MNTFKHHKLNQAAATKAKSAKITTVGELEQFTAGDSLIPDGKRLHLLWAVRRVRLLLGHGAPDYRLDPRAIMAQLHQLSPAMAGLSSRSLANLKSRFRAALRHAEPRLAQGRSRTRLVDQWTALYARLRRRRRYPLSRFMRFDRLRRRGHDHALFHRQGWQAPATSHRGD